MLDFAATSRARIWRDAHDRHTATYGLPSLRSAGFSTARVGRAVQLVKRSRTHANNNVASTQSQRPSVSARGRCHARVSVWMSGIRSPSWHSLCQRDGSIPFITIRSRGSSPTKASSRWRQRNRRMGSTHRLALARVAVPVDWLEPVGATAGTDGRLGFHAASLRRNPAITTFKLETSFTVTKGTLPRCALARCTSFEHVRSIWPAIAFHRMRYSTMYITCLRNRFPTYATSQFVRRWWCSRAARANTTRRIGRAAGDPQQLQHTYRCCVRAPYRATKDLARHGRNARHARYAGRPAGQGALLAGRQGWLVHSIPRIPTSPFHTRRPSSHFPICPIRAPGAAFRTLPGSRRGVKDAVQAMARHATVPLGPRRRLWSAQLR